MIQTKHIARQDVAIRYGNKIKFFAKGREISDMMFKKVDECDAHKIDTYTHETVSLKNYYTDSELETLSDLHLMFQNPDVVINRKAYIDMFNTLHPNNKHSAASIEKMMQGAKMLDKRFELESNNWSISKRWGMLLLINHPDIMSEERFVANCIN